MLAKLLKYDFKAMFKIFLPLWGVLLVVSGINRLFTGAGLDAEQGLGLVNSLMVLLYVLLIMAVMVVTTVIIIARFYQGLLKDEGYLMFTIPVKPWQLVASKLISAVVISMLSVLVAIVSVLIIASYQGFFYDLTLLWEALARLTPNANGLAILSVVSVFVGLIVCMLVILLLLVGSGLEPYYIREKKDNFTELYNEIDQITQNGEMTEDEISQINRTAERYNFYYIVWNFSNESGFSNLHDSQMLLMQLAGVLFNKIDSQVMEKNDNYQVVEFRDSAQQVDYLALWGTVGDSYNIFIRSPLESIQETMVLFYRFLIIVGLGVIAGGILFVWYFSRRLTEPLRELAVLSARMADLDFDAKYTSGGGGEIGALGENFNTMSEKLEATISELKNANFRLQQDIEQKEKIEKMRTDFMGNVSHELKTPIALIQGYAEGLKEGVSDDAQSREFYCDVIMDEASKMNQMVKNLMTLNQLEFGDEDVEFQRFDLTELIRGVIGAAQILIQQNGITVEFAADQPVYVRADEFKIEQVVTNYLSNAIHHADGEKKIIIRIQEEENCVRTSVFNTGNPIPEEALPNLWTKFYKVDKARTRAYGGTGIGLSIVKAIMDAHGQSCGVLNWQNGVEFWFTTEK